MSKQKEGGETGNPEVNNQKLPSPRRAIA